MSLDQQSKDKLEAVYRLTRYIVDDHGVNFTIRLDDDNAELREFLTSHHHRTWAFLTAYNPYSQTLTYEENITRQARLVWEIEDRDLEYYRGLGVGDNWEEPSLFVVNIGRPEAIGLGRQFDQNAILWGETEGEAELIWCVDATAN